MEDQHQQTRKEYNLQNNNDHIIDTTFDSFSIAMFNPLHNNNRNQSKKQLSLSVHQGNSKWKSMSINTSPELPLQSKTGIAISSSMSNK